MIKIYLEKENLDKYFQYMKTYIEKSDTKYSLKNIDDELLKLFNKTFEEIVKSSPAEMRALIEKNKDNFSNTILELKDLYEVFRNKWAVKLLEDLDLKVCPFCNREYIFKFEDTSKNKARIIASLDHYYDKDTYPFLAVSIYNLIPSCNICNSKFKHTKNFYKEEHLHPYEDDFNKLVKFKYCFHSCDDKNKKYPIFSENRIKITFDYPKQNKNIENTIKTFRLEELYNEHKDIVKELLQKRVIYSDSYIDELFAQYNGTLFSSREELLRLITCGYMSDEDINKRPLSKLIKDISEELGIVL